MFAEKLKQLREAQNLSQDALTDALNKKYETNISKSMISRWENGADIALSYARILADYFKMSPDEVLGFDTSNIVELHPTSSITLPVYSHLFAGMPDGAEEDIVGNIDVPNQIASKYGRKNLLAIKVDGDSMNKMIIDGSVAVVNTDDTEVQNGQVYAVIINGYANTLKHVYKYPDHIRFEPDSYNPTNKPFIYKEEMDIEVKIVGKLVYSVNEY